MTKQGNSDTLDATTAIQKAFHGLKFKGSSLQYEIATCIEMGHCIHIAGPFPCGD